MHQSYLTSPFTTLHSLAFCLRHVALAPLCSSSTPGRQRAFADLVLLNGPGSCVPIAASAFLPRVRTCSVVPPSPRTDSSVPRFTSSQLVGLSSAKLVYVESLARTQRLSLSGLLVRPLVDRFFVQWEGLRDKLKAQGGRSRLPAWLLAEIECEGWLV